MGYIIDYQGETDTLRPSQLLWQDCGAQGLSDFDLLGAWNLWYDDFRDLPTGKYTATQATAGTFALDDAAGGIALANCGSTTSTQGINVQANGTTGESFVPTAGKDIWFEARVRLTANATGPEFFLGLAQTDTTLIASSAFSSQLIGFGSLTDDSVILGHSKDGSSASNATGIQTAVAGTWYKLGMKITPTNVKFYVDGVYKNALATYIPATEMKFSLVCQSGGTTQPIVAIDWVRIAQAR
jgi:hypothetical protein